MKTADRPRPLATALRATPRSRDHRAAWKDHK